MVSHGLYIYLKPYLYSKWVVRKCLQQFHQPFHFPIVYLGSGLIPLFASLQTPPPAGWRDGVYCVGHYSEPTPSGTRIL